MDYSKELIRCFEEEKFISLPVSLHIWMDHLTSSEIMDILNIITNYIIIEDEDDRWERYITKHNLAYCVMSLLFTEIKYALYMGKYALGANGIEIFGDTTVNEEKTCAKEISESCLKLDELRELAEKINACDEYKEFADFTKDIDEIVNLDFKKSEMSFRLLASSIDSENALLAMHMLYYMRRVDSEEELKKRENIDISLYTADKLKDEIHRRNSSTFCYCFLDVATDSEREELYHHIKTLDDLKDPRLIILNASYQDLYLNRWISGGVAFPYLTYKILTEPDFEIKFFEDVEYNESNIISDDDLKNEDLAPLIPGALAADAKAQHELGIKYARLSSTAIHQNKSKYWLRLAANAGFVKSQISYGAVLYNDKKIAEAIEWYRKAAEAGNSEGQYRLGVAYADGIGVERNIDKARKWLTLSAQQDHFLAKFRLDNLK